MRRDNDDDDDDLGSRISIFELNEKKNILPTGLDPHDSNFTRCKWFYDTPGVVQKNQLINLLTTQELSITLPKTVVTPRIFHLKSGTSLFIGGLARLDFVSGVNNIW